MINVLVYANDPTRLAFEGDEVSYRGEKRRIVSLPAPGMNLITIEDGPDEDDDPDPVGPGDVGLIWKEK